MSKKRGLYIVFEGIVGSGKSTQIALLFQKLAVLGFVQIQTKEPGGDEVADAIRKTVQGTAFTIPVEPLVEVYLYAASRAQTLLSVVEPALKAGTIVLADRSFLSSVSFQGFGRRLGSATVLEVNRLAVQEYMPDYVIHLDIPVEVGIGRTLDADGDRFESEPQEFHERCAAGYREIRMMPEFKNIWHTVDGTGTVEEVHERIWAVMQPLVEEWQNQG